MAGVLEGKVALITGAGRGIGKVLAERLARDGAAIVANYAASASGAEEVVAAIEQAGGRAIAVKADITSFDQVKAMFARIDEAFGRLDIVVNCAGVSAGGALADVDEAQVDWLIGVNVKGPLFVASEASKRLADGGRIINFASVMAEYPMAGTGIYTACKMAVKGMTESWAKELGKRGITVNTVTPGPTAPGMMDSCPPGYREHFEKKSPFGRIGTAGEVAEVVAFLASPAASWVSGTHILAHGAAIPD
ncbi:SDR family oxidoreductase [Novosphingobium sp. TH158]|uniref:SDR family oxidoreductase n=1 Tax=Novosphingobium sp. TH158 TaxID=2067455 RepID=UPI000C7CC39A|nr:SDR family oxidoreductase [Novosphingobium sp. TH158]PLK27523.1 3-ketoacyl-ACP reductase [Novosphingobium sp. TH158]